MGRFRTEKNMTESREKGLPRVTAAALEIKVEYLASLLGILAAIRYEVVNQDEVWCVWYRRNPSLPSTK